MAHQEDMRLLSHLTVRGCRFGLPRGTVRVRLAVLLFAVFLACAILLLAITVEQRAKAKIRLRILWKIQRSLASSSVLGLSRSWAGISDSNLSTTVAVDAPSRRAL